MSFLEERVFQDEKRVTTHDDGCDYTKIFIARQNSAARARCGAFYVPPPKPQKVSDSTEELALKPLSLGVRVTYSKEIMIGIYQLSQLIKSIEIARLLSIPHNLIKKILVVDTARKKKLYEQAIDKKPAGVAEVLAMLRRVG